LALALSAAGREAIAFGGRRAIAGLHRSDVSESNGALNVFACEHGRVLPDDRDADIRGHGRGRRRDAGCGVGSSSSTGMVRRHDFCHASTERASMEWSECPRTGRISRTRDVEGPANVRATPSCTTPAPSHNHYPPRIRLVPGRRLATAPQPEEVPSLRGIPVS
jgi:hypothetical protein